jgi:hypothetical protein
MLSPSLEVSLLEVICHEHRLDLFSILCSYDSFLVDRHGQVHVRRWRHALAYWERELWRRLRVLRSMARRDLVLLLMSELLVIHLVRILSLIIGPTLVSPLAIIGKVVLTSVAILLAIASSSLVVGCRRVAGVASLSPTKVVLASTTDSVVT